MKIIDENGAAIENPDLTLGYLVDDTEPVEHPAVEGVEEVSHYETVTEYPGGGRDVRKVIDVPGVPEKVAPTSTAVGAALMNAMMAQAVADIVAAGGVPPVFVSANVDGGDEHNREMLKRYGSHIFYM